MSQTLIPFLAAALSASCAPLGAQEQTETRDLDLAACVELSRTLRPRKGAPRGWMPDGEHYLSSGALEEGQPELALVVSAADGAQRALFAPEQFHAAFAALPGVSADEARRWSERTEPTLTDDRRGILLEEKNDLFFWEIGAERARRLTHDPEEEVGVTLSPDGRLAAYIRDWNLHVVPTAGGEPLALTSDGDPDHLYGRLDWVYQEEIYGRGNFQGFWWSPDSARLAYLILDESAVPTVTITDSRERIPGVEDWRYPKAGDPNPKVALAVVDAGGGGGATFDLSDYAREEFLIVRVGWTPDATRVVFQVQDRLQTWLDLCLGDPATGKVTRLFRDQTGVWIEPNEGPVWSADGERFVWRSERDGWAHLYLYARDGALVRRLTEGAFEVDLVHALDAAGNVWFDCDRDDSKGSQLYRVSLEGGEPVRVSKEPGTHRISLSPTAAWFVDTWSSAVEPGHIAVHKGDGERVRVVDTADVLEARRFGLVPPEFFQVPTRDGFAMEAMLIRPRGFDAARKWPVVCFTYGGPHAPQVRDAWANFNMYYHQMLAQQGYAVWVCDNRSASGKGLQSSKGVYRSFGPGELADLEDGLDWLIAQGWADETRIGLWGWSFGGFMTSYALTHSKRFKVGIAGAPVTDWRLYDSIYTERYMRTPQDNPEGYARTSVVAAAAELSGRLLLIHGEIDENVHLQNTLQLAGALQKAGKTFDMMIYPGNRHPVVQPEQRLHLYATMADYLRTHL
jgi:dipeptidyl-peptidase-4